MMTSISREGARMLLEKQGDVEAGALLDAVDVQLSGVQDRLRRASAGEEVGSGANFLGQFFARPVLRQRS